MKVIFEDNCEYVLMYMYEKGFFFERLILYVYVIDWGVDLLFKMLFENY